MPDTFRTQNIAWQAKLQGVPLASFRARAPAFVIDCALLSLLLLLSSALPSFSGRRFSEDVTLTFETGSLVSFVAFVAYFGLATFVGKGATPGKWFAGIRLRRGKDPVPRR